MVYCGCATKAARLRWALVAGAIVTGIALLIRTKTEISSCRICYADGRCEKEWKGFQYHWENGREWVEDDEGNIYPGAHMSCSVGIWIVCHLLAQVCFIAATIPCCYNCCCAKGPGQDLSFQMLEYAPQGVVPLAPYHGAVAADGNVALAPPNLAAIRSPSAAQRATQQAEQQALRQMSQKSHEPLQASEQQELLSADEKSPLL